MDSRLRLNFITRKAARSACAVLSCGLVRVMTARPIVVILVFPLEVSRRCASSEHLGFVGMGPAGCQPGDILVDSIIVIIPVLVPRIKVKRGVVARRMQLVLFHRLVIGGWISPQGSHGGSALVGLSSLEISRREKVRVNKPPVRDAEGPYCEKAPTIQSEPTEREAPLRFFFRHLVVVPKLLLVARQLG